MINRQNQGKKNALYVQQNPEELYLYWLAKQAHWTSTDYIPLTNIKSVVNLTHRNWTTLSDPSHETQIKIDPSGMIFLDNVSWGCTHFIAIDNTLYTPTQNQSHSQSFDTKSNTLTTTYHIDDCHITLQTTFQLSTINTPTVSTNIIIKNTASHHKKVSALITVLPFTLDGVGKIQSIQYLSENALVIDKTLGLLTTEKPSNVVCLTHQDGSITHSFGKWDMILKSQCTKHAAKAYVQYDHTLQANQTAEITYHLTDTPLKPNSSDAATQLPKTKPVAHYSTPHLQIPDKQILELYEKNVVHLIHTAPHVPKLSDTHTFCRALNQLGHSPHHIWPHYIHDSKIRLIYPFLPAIWAQKLVSVANQIEYDNTTTTIAPYQPMINQLCKRLQAAQQVKKPHLSTFGLIKANTSQHTEKDIYLWDNFWAASGFKSAQAIMLACDKPDLANTYSLARKRLLESIRTFLTDLFEKRPDKPHLISGLHQPFNSTIIHALCAVYPLNLIDPMDPLVTETLRLIESQLSHNGIFFNTVGHNGYHVVYNCWLAQVYIARQETAKAHRILDWLSLIANASGSFPTSIHPQTQGGTAGLGHDPLASAEYILLVHAMLAKWDHLNLKICPFLPKKWLSPTMTPIRIRDLHTRFGPISFTFNTHDHWIEFNWTHKLHKLPNCQLSFPLPIKQASIDKRPFTTINAHHINFSTTNTNIRLKFNFDDPDHN